MSSKKYLMQFDAGAPDQLTRGHVSGGGCQYLLCFAQMTSSGSREFLAEKINLFS
jgi:hypothetical protein